ncbi:MAG: site-2 protease family protein [Anaerolineae bacterium]|nr:site-2 protease family protein [Anaerolineae bacterium]
MGSGFRIGRLFGININIDWSWLLILVLVTWNLSAVFGQTHGDWGAALSWGVAFIAALLFFASVLAHELAHSLVARARGMPVRNITLFLFGGVSNIEREPPSAGGEFLMAIVGPLTSVVIGLVLTVAGGAAAGPLGDLSDPGQAIGQLGPVTTLVLWLGSVNILVGLFNMIPAFPLDGGRVLRSFFWAASGNLRQATRWASWIGQGVAWLLILVGISMVFGLQVPLLGSGPISGLWLVFIGWFLNSSASQSYRQVVIQDVLEGIPVSRMMRRNPPTVTPGLSVSSLVHDTVMQSDDHAFPVLEGGRLAGLVCLHDVRAVSREAWETTTVREIMTPAEELVTVTPDEQAVEALHKLQQRDVRQLPVIEDGSLAGLLRRQDVIKYLRLEQDMDVGRQRSEIGD